MEKIWENLSLIDMSGEVWLQIPGWEGFYDVSNLGRIKSLARWVKAGTGMRFLEEKILSQSKSRGYLHVVLCNGSSSSKSMSTHRAVALAFIPNPDNKPEVNHKFGIKTDNRVEMLEWFTSLQQKIHAQEIGLKVVTNPKKPPRPAKKIKFPPIVFTPDELANEEWREIKWTKGLYMVSDLGHVKGIDRKILVMRQGHIIEKTRKGKLLNPKQTQLSNGYVQVAPSLDGIKTHIAIHQLVLEAFNPNINNLPQIHHIDHIRNNNRLTNLEWIDYSKHNKEKFNNGYVNTTTIGEKASHAKLTDLKVIEIREKRASGKYKITELAEYYGVSENTIELAVKRKTWKHVPKSAVELEYEELKKAA